MVPRNTKYVISAVLCILGSQAVSSAADYYVNAAGGNDGNSGQSSAAPWRTVAKVNAVSFAPGDRIFFARGGIWRESLMPRTSGVAGSPITFGAYGSGAAPVLAGSNDLTGYTWRKSVSGTNTYYGYASGIEPPDVVWLNGAPCTRGTAGSLADHQWDWNNRDSLGFSTVYIRDDSGMPGVSGVLVESAARDYTVFASGKSYLTFENLEVRHTDDYGFSYGVMHFNSCKNITIRNCTVHDVTANGIKFIGAGSANHVIQDNVVYNALPPWSYPCLISMFDTNTATISRNTIYNAVGQWAVGMMVLNSCSNLTIEQNNIYNCNGDHVYLRGYASGNTVRYNYLHDGSGTGVMIREGASNNKVYGNQIAETGAGVSINNTGGATSYNLVYNNTICSEARSNGGGIVVVGAHAGTQIRNNCVRTNDEYALFFDAAAAGVVTSNNNCVYNTSSFRLIHWAGANYLMSGFATYQSVSGQDRNSMARDPLFANLGGRDFTFQSSSPCIGTAVDLGDTYRYDLGAGSTWPSGVRTLDQRAYGTWEIGAYVYGSAPATGYTLTTSATNGTITRTPNQSSYTSGTTVTLQATPNSGYVFTGWSGDLTGTTNPATLVMNSNKSVTANFTPVPSTTYTLTVSATNGTVTRTPSKTSYASGETVTLQATPNSGYTFTGWSGDLTGTTNPATLVMNSNKSVTANFAASTGGTTTKKVGTTTVFSSVTKEANRRATPYTMAETGQLQSISIYHQGGSGRMLLGVYADSSGKPGSRLGITSTTTVSSIRGWQTVALQSPVAVSAGQKIWLAWVFERIPGIRYTKGTPGRASSPDLWPGGMPATFGTSTLGNYIYSIYATYATTSTISSDTTAPTSGAVGTTTVLSSITRDTNRRAMAYTAPGAGQLQSISIYHQAGSGQMILGVYADSSGRPGSRLGVTSSTTVSSTTGWQKVNLQSPVAVSAGQRIWLAWIFQSNPGIRYASGIPGRASSSGLWSGGMPTTFGTSTVANYIYSIYASYSSTSGTAAAYSIAADEMLVEMPTIDDSSEAIMTPKAKGNIPQTRGTSRAAERARTPKAEESVTDGQEQIPPAIVDGDLMPDPATTANTMMLLRVRDAGKGVNPASVSIEVDGHIVYSGDVEASNTSYGVCVRTGTKADYRYLYQPKESTGEQVVVAVNARDLAGNVMPEQTYLFDTAASVPAPTQSIAPEPAGEDQNSVSDEAILDQSNLDQRRPAIVRDGTGNTWSAWQAGDVGQRQIYVSRVSEGVETAEDTFQVTQGEGDHCNPAIAVDGAGVLYVVWQESTRGNWDVCTSVSPDGKAWSSPKAIVDANDNQVNPAIAASRQPNGLVAVLWQDDRADNQDVYMATSTDAFTTAEVTAVTSDEADQTDPAVIVDGEDAIFMRWTDTRTNSAAEVEAPQEP